MHIFPVSGSNRLGDERSIDGDEPSISGKPQGPLPWATADRNTEDTGVLVVAYRQQTKKYTLSYSWLVLVMPLPARFLIERRTIIGSPERILFLASLLIQVKF